MNKIIGSLIIICIGVLVSFNMYEINNFLVNNLDYFRIMGFWILIFMIYIITHKAEVLVMYIVSFVAIGFFQIGQIEKYAEILQIGYIVVDSILIIGYIYVISIILYTIKKENEGKSNDITRI